MTCYIATMWTIEQVRLFQEFMLKSAPSFNCEYLYKLFIIMIFEPINCYLLLLMVWNIKVFFTGAFLSRIFCVLELKTFRYSGME